MSTLASVFGYGAVGSRPAAAVAGRFYYGTDTFLMYRDNGSTWDTLSVGAGSMAADGLWDAAGDLAVGTGSNTGAKLSIGAAGGALSVINGAVAWNSGTSFPASKLTGDRYWRTDLGMEFYWDGTRWLSTHLFTSDVDSGAFISAGITVSGTSFGRITPMHSTFDLWLVNLYASLYVATTNTGSAYWTVTLKKYQSDLSTNSTVTSVNTSANAANTVVTSETAIGALLVPATYKLMQLEATKTGSPGLLQAPPCRVSYRLVGV